MHEMRTIPIDDPVAWVSVSLSHGRLFLLIRQMAPLRRGHYYITVFNAMLLFKKSYKMHPSSGYMSSQAQLEALHWLPVCQRIVFKVAVLTYKTLHTQQSAYLHRLLHPYQPSRTLRSASQDLIQIPLLQTNFGRCSLSYTPGITSRTQSETHLSTLHLKLALYPTCLTLSTNTSILDTTAFSPSGVCPRLRFDFFRPCARYKF